MALRRTQQQALQPAAAAAKQRRGLALLAMALHLVPVQRRRPKPRTIMVMTRAGRCVLQRYHSTNGWDLLPLPQR